MSILDTLSRTTQTMLLTILPSGGQGTARRNAFAAAVAARSARWERLAAFAALDAVSDTVQPAAS